MDLGVQRRVDQTLLILILNWQVADGFTGRNCSGATYVVLDGLKIKITYKSLLDSVHTSI